MPVCSFACLLRQKLGFDKMKAALVLSVLATTASAGTILLPPIAGKTGASKLMVFIPGGAVPNEHYELTAKAIQEASSLNLWITIPSCIGCVQLV